MDEIAHHVWQTKYRYKENATSGTRQLRTLGGSSHAPSPPLNRAIENGGKTSFSKFLRATSFCPVDGFWPAQVPAAA
jgi:hypothetical protein